jgi:hypothetical protein
VTIVEDSVDVEFEIITGTEQALSVIDTTLSQALDRGFYTEQEIKDMAELLTSHVPEVADVLESWVEWVESRQFLSNEKMLDLLLDARNVITRKDD